MFYLENIKIFNNAFIQYLILWKNKQLPFEYYTTLHMKLSKVYSSATKRSER